MDSDGWVGVDDIAEQIGPDQDPSNRWVGSRNLPAHKLRHLLLFKLSKSVWAESLRGKDKGANRGPSAWRIVRAVGEGYGE